MNKLTQATVAELKNKLAKAGVKFPKKAPRAELLALLAAAQQTQHSAAPTKAAKPRSSVKQTIRERFPNVGDRVAVEMLLAVCKAVKEGTVQTMLSDLKNAKYAGKGGVVRIEKDGGDYVRVA